MGGASGDTNLGGPSQKNNGSVNGDINTLNGPGPGPNLPGPDAFHRRLNAPNLTPADIQTVLADVTHKPGTPPDVVKKNMRKPKKKKGKK